MSAYKSVVRYTKYLCNYLRAKEPLMYRKTQTKENGNDFIFKGVFPENKQNLRPYEYSLLKCKLAPSSILILFSIHFLFLRKTDGMMG